MNGSFILTDVHDIPNQGVHLTFGRAIRMLYRWVSPFFCYRAAKDTRINIPAGGMSEGIIRFEQS